VVKGLAKPESRWRHGPGRAKYVDDSHLSVAERRSYSPMTGAMLTRTPMRDGDLRHARLRAA